MAPTSGSAGAGGLAGWGRAVHVKSLQGLGAWPSAILSNSSWAWHTSTQTLATPQVPETLTAAGGGVMRYIRWGRLIRGFLHETCLMLGLGVSVPEYPLKKHANAYPYKDWHANIDGFLCGSQELLKRRSNSRC